MSDFKLKFSIAELLSDPEIAEAIDNAPRLNSAERNAEPLVQDVLIPDQPTLFSFDSDTPNFLDLRLDMFVARQELIPTELLDAIDLSQILRVSKENPVELVNTIDEIVTELKRGFQGMRDRILINAEAETLYAKQVLNFQNVSVSDVLQDLTLDKEFLNAASTKTLLQLFTRRPFGFDVEVIEEIETFLQVRREFKQLVHINNTNLFSGKHNLVRDILALQDSHTQKPGKGGILNSAQTEIFVEILNRTKAFRERIHTRQLVIPARARIERDKVKANATDIRFFRGLGKLDEAFVEEFDPDFLIGKRFSERLFTKESALTPKSRIAEESIGIEDFDGRDVFKGVHNSDLAETSMDRFFKTSKGFNFHKISVTDTDLVARARIAEELIELNLEQRKKLDKNLEDDAVLESFRDFIVSLTKSNKVGILNDTIAAKADIFEQTLKTNMLTQLKVILPEIDEVLLKNLLSFNPKSNFTTKANISNEVIYVGKSREIFKNIVETSFDIDLRRIADPKDFIASEVFNRNLFSKVLESESQLNELIVSKSRVPDELLRDTIKAISEIHFYKFGRKLFEFIDTRSTVRKKTFADFKNSVSTKNHEELHRVLSEGITFDNAQTKESSTIHSNKNLVVDVSFIERIRKFFARNDIESNAETSQLIILTRGVKDALLENSTTAALTVRKGLVNRLDTDIDINAQNLNKFMKELHVDTASTSMKGSAWNRDKEYLSGPYYLEAYVSDSPAAPGAPGLASQF